MGDTAIMGVRANKMKQGEGGRTKCVTENPAPEEVCTALCCFETRTLSQRCELSQQQVAKSAARQSIMNSAVTC